MPEWTAHIRFRLASLRLSPTRENEIVEELSQHLDDWWRELTARGASDEEAMRAVLARLQNDSLVRNLAGLKQARQTSSAPPGVAAGHWLRGIGRDIGHATRLFRRQPGFAVTAVLTLALGLGSATALFSWTDRLFLRPLPVSEPARMFDVGERSEKGHVRTEFSYPEYLEYRRLDRAFADLAAYDPRAMVELDVGGGAERTQAALVSANYFAVLGVKPILGRTFDADADKAQGTHPFAVLSYATWQRLFAGDREVVGRTVRLNGHMFTIIGVAPQNFTGLMRGVYPSLFVPISMLGQVRPSWTARPLTDAKHAWLALTARVPSGQSAEHAGAIATASLRALTGTKPTLTLTSGARGRGDSVRALESSGKLFSAAGLVLLLIVCANVSGLFAARAAGLRREFATRLALGASRVRLIRYSLVEALLTTLLGGALGVIWAKGLTIVLGRMRPAAPQPPEVDIRTFVFTSLLMLAATAIVGVVPAMHFARGDALASLKNRGGMSGWRNASWQKGLVVAQLALCLTALVVAGLCLRSGARLAAVDTGIDERNIVLATFDPSAAGYSPEKGMLFYEALRERVAALPGITSASLARLVPFEGRDDSRTLGVPGYTPAPGENMNVSQNWVGPDYFATIGVRLLGGREFRSTDRTGTLLVAVINETMARRFWPGQDPVGKRLSYARDADIQIIGLVKDHRARTPSEQPTPMLYLPYRQRYQAELTLAARADHDAGGYAAMIRDAAMQLDPAVRPYDLRTMASERERSLAGARHTTEISAVFGALCLIVSAVGLYGTLAQAVTRRTREIALRMALGASASRTVSLVVRDAMGLVGFALIPGFVSAFVASRLLSALLYESAPVDVPVVAGATTFLIVAALIAAWRPARWAANVDPMTALQGE